MGRAKRVKIAQEDTTIIDGAGLSKEIKARTENLRKEISNTPSDYDWGKLQERLAKLAGAIRTRNEVKYDKATTTTPYC